MSGCVSFDTPAFFAKIFHIRENIITKVSHLTGSSSLQLSDDINESATGRLLEFNLLPFSLQELSDNKS